VVVLAREGTERAAEVWNAANGRTYGAAKLGAGEAFAGEGLASSSRLWFATTRNLLLLDRTRELFALDSASLKPLRTQDRLPGFPGGSVFARGSTVCVLGATSLWVFEAQR
jgi:hypothetical protein